MNARQTLERTLHAHKAWRGSGPRSHSWVVAGLERKPRCQDSQAKQAEPAVPLGSAEHRDHQLAQKATPHRNSAWLTLMSPEGLLTPTRHCCPHGSIFTTHTHSHTQANSNTLHAYLRPPRLSELNELVLKAGMYQHPGKFWNPQATTILPDFWRWVDINEIKRCPWGGNVFLWQILFHLCKWCKIQ